MTDKEFEQAVARIQIVLKGKDAKVTWDDHIPDPDNPGQKRQIDITIKRGKKITHVECRHWQTPQDVKWVEELYGRKASLRAHAVIGVSSSGFTGGAALKARALGIFIREFKELSDEEIKRWGEPAKVTLRYAKFEEPKIHLIMPRTFPGRLPPPVEITDTMGKPFEIIDLFRNAANELVKAKISNGVALLPVKCLGLKANGFELKEIFLESRWRLVERRVGLPSVFQYVNPAHQKKTKEALVQRFGSSAFELHHNTRGGFFTFLDFSFTPIIKSAFLREIDLDLGKPQHLIGVGIWGRDDRLVTFPDVQLLNTYEGSAFHSGLVQKILPLNINW